MKKTWLILFIALGLVGCASIKQKLADVKLCWHNDACRAEAVLKADDLGGKAEQLASLSGFPWASKVAKPAVSYLALIVILGSLGGALRQKEAVQ